MASKVILRDLRKCYGGVEAVQGVSFEIAAGEIFGLLGANGAGKTTTLECVLGLREPDSGLIEVCGVDARRNPREVKQRVGAALQSTALQDKLTPREALALFGTLYRQSATPDELIARFGLGEKADAPFESLSGGQRQRLALALAFVNRPELVFLDEPTTGLDPVSRRELHDEIRRMKADGHTVLLTTHYLEEAELLCDRIAIMDRGRVVATGTPAELIGRSSALQTVTLVAAGPLDVAQLGRIPGAQDLTVEGAHARFRVRDTGRALPAIGAWLETNGIELVDLRVRKATLEDVFIALTGRAPDAP